MSLRADALRDPIAQNPCESCRRPRFLQHVKAEMAAAAAAAADSSNSNFPVIATSTATGEAATAIMELLLEHGRLRLDQIVPAVVSRLTQDHEKAVAAAAAGEGAAVEAGVPDEGDVRRAFLQLTRERYVERVPPCNLRPPTLEAQLAPGKRKSNPKPGGFGFKTAMRRYNGARWYIGVCISVY